MKTVNIGIQARLTSTRLPEKILKTINGNTVLNHVIKQVSSSIKYINKHSSRNNIQVKLFILAPLSTNEEHNSIIKSYESDLTEVLLGPENEDDVLLRYYMLLRKHPSDYVVRITSDCPMVPPALITKSIMIACKAGVDLVTTPTYVNIDIDGRDRDAAGDTWDIGADEFVAANFISHMPLLGTG